MSAPFPLPEHLDKLVQTKIGGGSEMLLLGTDNKRTWRRNWRSTRRDKDVPGGEILLAYHVDARRN